MKTTSITLLIKKKIVDKLHEQCTLSTTGCIKLILFKTKVFSKPPVARTRKNNVRHERKHVVVFLRLSEHEKQELLNAAKALGVTPNGLVNLILKKYLENPSITITDLIREKEKPLREQIIECLRERDDGASIHEIINCILRDKVIALLKELEKKGIVSRKREGKKITYILNLENMTSSPPKPSDVS